MMALLQCCLLFCRSNNELPFVNDMLSGCCGEESLESVDDIYNGIIPYGNAVIPEYKTFMHAYFNELYWNIGFNQYGSCGYVALGMMLSYYDTFLNDGIIPEQYDVVSVGNNYGIFHRDNSPGISSDSIEASTPAEYISKVKELVDVSLHAKLLTYGEKRGYFNRKNDYVCGTTVDERKNVLIDYLTEIGFVNGRDYSISIFDGKKNREYISLIKSMIDMGYPVLVALEGLKGGHAVVAYDYEWDDNENCNIYAHYGYKGKNVTHSQLLGKDYNKITSIMTIKFNMSHTHTNNYGVSQNGYTTYYCSCDCRLSYNSKIKLTYSYSYVNDKVHNGICIFCGDIYSGGHQAKAGSAYTYNGHKYVTCSLCKHAVCIDNNIIIGTMQENGNE